jgi:O-antigen ligase
MAMNGSSVHSNQSLTGYGQSLNDVQKRSSEIPLISFPTWIALMAYLFTLAITQTVYADPFMNMRWIALGAVTAAAIADWMLIGIRGKHRIQGYNGHLLAVYLLATFGTIIYAENWVFSGMRWASHAAMLVVFLLFLPQIMIPGQTRRIALILKVTMSTLLIFSWLRPIIELIPDTGEHYHGAMGNSNTMGHIASITAILYLSSVFSAKRLWPRLLSAAMTAAAILTVWMSGARSSIIALFIGVLLLFHYHRRETQRYVMAAILLGGLTMTAFPNLPSEISRFITKADEKDELSLENPVLRTRIPTWSAAYDGFKQRPLLGWGFGASSQTPKDTEVGLTAWGLANRDAVNDFMFMLEGCGIVGFLAYLLLIYIVFRQRPSRSQKSILYDYSQGKAGHSGDISLHQTHALLYILAVSLLALNQFDNTALSAGNLICMTLWISAGCAITLRHEMNQSQPR